MTKEDLRKILAALLVLTALTLILIVSTRDTHASIFPISQRLNTSSNLLMNASGTTTTNTVGNSVFIEADLYHTFQAVNGSGAAQQFAIDWSLDNTNFVVDSTNSVAVSGTSGVTKTGKWSYTRVRQIGTNSSLVILYLGGN